MQDKSLIKIKRIGLFIAPLLTHGGGAEKYFINLAKSLSKKILK